MTRSFDDLDEAVVVDVETSGLLPETDRIISVSLLRVCFATLDRQTNYHRLEGDTLDATVNPQCPMHAAATRVHGITNADVADAGPSAEAAQQIRDFIGTRPIIAHNVAFDQAFLNAEFKRAGVKTLHRKKQPRPFAYPLQESSRNRPVVQSKPRRPDQDKTLHLLHNPLRPLRPLVRRERMPSRHPLFDESEHTHRARCFC